VLYNQNKGINVNPTWYSVNGGSLEITSPTPLKKFKSSLRNH